MCRCRSFKSVDTTTTARVFAHAKRCLKLTEEQRRLAFSASASKSPGALVAADNTQETGKSKVIPSPQSITNSQSSFSSLSSSNSSLLLKASDTPNPPLARTDGFFSPQGRQKTHCALDLAIVNFFCVARIPPTVADISMYGKTCSKYLY
jgi:hypothetical protein